jgi:hypothetical protein
MMKIARAAIASAALALFGSAVLAQDRPPTDPQSRDTRYNVQEMNFDMWCQEEQHLAPDRCDKRLPEDDAAFNAYRTKIEQYEIPYLQEQQKQIDINSGIIHNDPVDHPNAPTKQTQAPTSSSPASPQ